MFYALSTSFYLNYSDIRQVPDTQEVLLYPDSSVSIVVEILERVQPEDDEGAAKYVLALVI